MNARRDSRCCRGTAAVRPGDGRRQPGHGDQRLRSPVRRCGFRPPAGNLAPPSFLSRLPCDPRGDTGGSRGGCTEQTCFGKSRRTSSNNLKLDIYIYNNKKFSPFQPSQNIVCFEETLRREGCAQEGRESKGWLCWERAWLWSGM